MKLTAARLDLNDAGLATLTLTQADRGNPFDGTFIKSYLDRKSVV